MRVLFVCLGNICRSPAAEGVMLGFLQQAGMEKLVSVSSAGTSHYHVGELPDQRMRDHAAKRNFKLESKAQQISLGDLAAYDYILVMDRNNYRHVKELDSSGQYHRKIYMLTDFCQKLSATEVPDPYYGGDQGFETVLDILEDACTGLLEQLREDLNARL